MKKYILFVIIGIGSLSSCSKFLDVPVESNISTSNFFKSKEDFDMAIAGTYNVLTSAEWNPGHRWGNYFEGMLYLGRVGTDECFTVYGDNEHQISNYTFTPSNYIVSRVWFVQYLGISRCNTVIDRMSTSEAAMTEDQRNTILGEAYFLRGFFYFNLARFYGEVPLVLNEVTDINSLDIKKASLKEVYSQIINDFERAGELLPIKNTNGRAHKYAAITFLAKAYLQMSGMPLKDPDAAKKAEIEAKKVIDSGLFGLVNNYFSLFDASNEYSAEYIFDVEFSNTADATKYGGQVATTDGISTPYSLYWQKVRTCKEFFEKFNPSDKRRNNIADFRYVLQGTNLVEDRDPAAIGDNYFVYKFRHPLNENDRGSTWVNWSNPINFPITRYADLLLTYAEASARANNSVSPAVLEYVNKIRRRGFGVEMNTANSTVDLPVMSAADFLKALLQERSFELCFEGHRWFDLVRYGQLEEGVKSLSKYEGTLLQTSQALNFRERNKILPIPQDVIDASHGKIEQNPLWR